MRRRRMWAVVGCAAAVILIAAAVWYVSLPKALYRLTVLPLAGTKLVAGAVLNDRGQVAGFRERTGATHLFLWDREHGLQDLREGRGLCYDINNQGQIVGSVQDVNGVEQAFLWDPNSGMHLLSTRNSMAYAINDRGWVVGSYETPDKNWRAFLWDQMRGLRDLGPAGSGFRYAFALNEARQAIVVRGNSAFLVQLDEHGAVQTCDSLPVWGPPRVNDRGRVAGMMRAGDKTSVGLWDANAGVRTLSREAFQTGIAAINDAGQVLFGQVRNAPAHVLGRTLWEPPWLYFLWDPNRGEIPLNRYAGLQKGEACHMMDLNNNGCIVGRVWSNTRGPSRVVLLEPTPERWGK